MSYSVKSPRDSHKTKSPSPLRHAATISYDSEDEDALHRGLASPSRASAYTTNSQYSYTSGHKRGVSDLSPSKTFSPSGTKSSSPYTSPVRQSRPRQTLGDLTQATNVSSIPVPSLKPASVHSRAQSFDAAAMKAPAQGQRPQQPQFSLALGRSNSRRAPVGDQSGRLRGQDGLNSVQPALLEDGDLEQLGRSTTDHLRTLSKLAENGVEKDFAIRTKEQEVTGLTGRRRLQGNMMTKERPLQAPGYGGRIWLDQQRQFLQAYEYLCHIGEAKEWIQDVIQKEIPPIVQLEEHLRDGVTLAEVVQSIHHEKPFRIFRNARLQYRHSDNIAIFFNFLAEVELPELFRFELVDLYEKKNIPKVIYCIHALSWSLFRKGILDFKIGNLVGQLEFEHHELEEVQKGLDQSGVSMPNFSGLRQDPEPEPEPIETEEDRIDRELKGNEHSIEDFQAQLRGALLRLSLGETMHMLFQEEDWITDLQARLRGDWARQVSNYQLVMRECAIGVQSAARGFMVRTRHRRRGDDWKNHEQDVVHIQALVRARTARRRAQKVKNQVKAHESGVCEVQAAIRGAMQRLRMGEHHNQVHDTQTAVIDLQRHIRGMLQRRHQQQRTRDFESLDPVWSELQACFRGFLARSNHRAQVHHVAGEVANIVSFQTQLRAQRARSMISRQKADLAGLHAPIEELQCLVRGFLLRNAVKKDMQKLKASTHAIEALQTQARGFIYRGRLFDLLEGLKEHDFMITELQSLTRAMIVRLDVTDQLEAMVAVEDEVTDLQALARAMLVKKKFEEKQRHFQENMKKVIKIQSFVRGRQQGQAYKSLTSGKNPPVGTVKNFVHLLNDSDFDFEEEIESEKLQQTLVGHIQDIEKLEAWIAEMDAKIGLLAHNKIASDEAARLKYMPSSAYRGTPTKDSFNLRTLNKTSRTKLERYQELFFILQTQPQYLARLFRKSRELGAAEADQKKLESLVMSTFAHAQKQREEYYLLKLLVRSLQEEVEACATIQDFIRGSFFFNRLFSVFTRVPKDRKYVRQTFSQLIRDQILEDQNLNLESDPQLIYRAILNDEELRTGRRTRDPSLPRELAIREEDVRGIFIKNLQDIRDLVDSSLLCLEDSVPRMPYGTRYVAKQSFDTLCARYPREDPRDVLQIVGFWVWKNYLKPAFVDPEGLGVVDRGLDPADKRNLGVLTLVLNQIASGKLFGEEHVYLQPLNRHLTNEAFARMEGIWAQVIDIADAEEKFDIGQFNDFYAKVKPTLYIKMADVFAMHQMVANEVSFLCTTQDDIILRDVLKDLGNPKSNEAEMSAGQSEVTLALGGRMHTVEDPDAEVKALFMETKRCVLYIIRIQTGANLMEVMVRPITIEDEDRWDALVREELSATNTTKRNAYTEPGSNNLVDITSLSYAELKSIALENILGLEKRGRLTRKNNYQDLLNDIAVDIRNKHRRRVQRQRELETVRSTISHLKEKQKYLQEKLDAYNNTYEQSLTTLQNKSARRNGLKKFTNPFGKQAHHLRELARRGEEPRFGSYKYSAATLATKGILLSWEGRHLKEDDVTVSSDAINEFVIEGSHGQMMIPGAVSRFTWDELLEAEYEGRDIIEFFGEPDGREGGEVGTVTSRKSVDVRRGKSVDLGPRRGVLMVDRRAFSEWLSNKFWREAA